MKRLLAIAGVAALGFGMTAGATEKAWFNGGIATGFPQAASMTGGTWGDTATAAMFADGAVTPNGEEITFTADDAQALVGTNAKVTTSVMFTAYDYDDVPEVDADDKAGVIVVDAAGTLTYKVLAKGGWQTLAGTPNLESAVDVTVEMVNYADVTYVKYTVDGNASGLLEANASGDTLASVTYVGQGEISALASTTAEVPVWRGAGTEADPYLIEDKAGLVALQESVAATNNYAGTFFKMTTDIALDAVWPGIGIIDAKDMISGAKSDFVAYTNVAFCGVFDGNNKTISGVKIRRGDYTGFFNATCGATIKNFKIGIAGDGFETAAEARTAYQTKYSAGLVVGVAKATTIQNVTTLASDTPFTADKAIAGFVGYFRSGEIVDCTNNLAITCTGNNKVGGFASITQGGDTSEPKDVTFTRCVNNAAISCTVTTENGVGGIIGYKGGDVTFVGCKSIGVTSGGEGSYVGSLIGRFSDGSLIMGEGNEASAAVKPLGYGSLANLNFAQVTEGVAMFVADSAAAVNGANLKVMMPGKTVTLAAVGDSVTFDETLATVTVVTTAENAEVKHEGSVYTVVSTKPADPIPPAVDPETPATTVSNTINTIEFKSPAVKEQMQKIVKGDAGTYNKFVSWSTAVGQAAVTNSSQAAVSFQLKNEGYVVDNHLFAEEPKVEIKSLTTLDGGNLKIDVTFKDGETDVAAVKAKVAETVKASTDLKDWDTNKPTVEVTEDGGLKVTPPAGDKAFLRVNVPLQ